MEDEVIEFFETIISDLQDELDEILEEAEEQAMEEEMEDMGDMGDEGGEDMGMDDMGMGAGGGLDLFSIIVEVVIEAVSALVDELLSDENSAGGQYFGSGFEGQIMAAGENAKERLQEGFGIVEDWIEEEYGDYPEEYIDVVYDDKSGEFEDLVDEYEDEIDSMVDDALMELESLGLDEE